ncbi:Uncharacterized protein FWK35_00035519 [Aphis craccivora]|uniref:Uncharacterized protein n=1 Tax=Aphis craccivora TaxID=307492 RepID=A0A6G0VJI4_APHCR|nr:Uncharacterized protein FWK35_00035519 [Aphis craccivora]
MHNLIRSDEEESVIVSEIILRQHHHKKRNSEKVWYEAGEETGIKKYEKGEAPICYTDKILDLIAGPIIPTVTENTLNIKKDEDSLTVKTPVENTAIDYWTIAHYKCAKTANVAPQDRWKHAECLLKISLTGQHPDDLTTGKEMVTIE